MRLSHRRALVLYALTAVTAAVTILNLSTGTHLG
jgi:hypothetical protein